MGAANSGDTAAADTDGAANEGAATGAATALAEMAENLVALSRLTLADSKAVAVFSVINAAERRWRKRGLRHPRAVPALV